MTSYRIVGGRAAALTGLWLIAIVAPAAAQQPTAAQQNAIRQNCRSDFMANCSGVQPGGREALQCLQRNSAKLSSACQGAVAAISPPAAPAQAAPATPAPAAAAPPATAPAARASAPVAAAPATAAAPTPQQRGAIQQSCRSDFMANCSGVQPGGAAALQCLQRNAAKLSPPCQGAVAAISGGTAAAPTAAAAAPAMAAAPPAAAPMPIIMRPRLELLVMRTCRFDVPTFCGDVPPGGGRVIGCLMQNEAQVSPLCRQALAEARRL